MRGVLALVMALSVTGVSNASAERPPAAAAGPVDFNGDGFADLAVGVAAEDVAGVLDAGAVNVLYGAPSGVQATAPDDQFWTQQSRGVNGQVGLFELFGIALAAGDFNADGFTDLAIGVPGEAPGGAVNVLYGSPAGLQTRTPRDQLWTQDSPGVADRVESGDQFGNALASGDFNADGFADLAIGAYGEDVGRRFDVGAASVLYGSGRGLQAESPNDQVWAQDSKGVLDDGEDGDGFGNALAARDFDGDGFDDLAVAVSSEAIEVDGGGALFAAGAANVLYGSPGGLAAAGNQFWHQDAPGVLDQAEELDVFANALAAGDFNGDGKGDLAVGVVFEETGPAGNAGAVALLHGSSGGLQADAPDDQLWTQDSPDVEDQQEDSDQFGATLGAGDFNGDAFTDLAIGVNESLGDIPFTGAVNVLYGSASGLQALSPADQFWHQDSPGVLDQAEDFDAFAAALGSHDFDADGVDDLAIGVLFEDLGPPGRGVTGDDQGAMHVLYGTGGGLQSDQPDDQFWNQDSRGVKDTAEQVDLFGQPFA